MGKKITFGEILQIADKNSPAILTGLVCAGVVGTTLLAWFNGHKAKEIIEDYKIDCDNLYDELVEDAPFHNLEHVNVNDVHSEAESKQKEIQDKYQERRRELTTKMALGVAMNALPVVVMGGCTIACAIGANTVSTKRIAALTAAYSISEKALTEYTGKVQEMLGDNKAAEVKSAISEDKVKANPPKVEENIIRTGHGTQLWFDDYTGRYFYSDPEYIRKVVNDINEQLRDDYYVSLNDFYERLGLPDCKLGSDIGFCIEDGNLNVSFSFTGATIGDRENVPCGVLNYDVSPKYGFGDSSGARFNR